MSLASDHAAVRNIGEQYFRFSAKLIPTVDLVLAGASTVEVAAELSRLSNIEALSTEQAQALLERVFRPHNVAVELSGIPRSNAQTFTLVPGRAKSRVDSILLKVTIIPGPIANWLANRLSILYSLRVAMVVLVLSAASLASYVATFGIHVLSLSFALESQRLLSSSQVAIQIAIMLTCFLLHEMGHCSASARFGRSVRRVGFGVYWLFPALFSDVTSSWELKRFERVTVDLGGIYFQLALCGLLALAAMLSDASLSRIFETCIVLNFFSILASLNPMLKFDGYWVYADFFRIHNLRKNSLDLAKRLAGAILTRRFSSAAFRDQLPLLFYAICSIAYGALFADYLANSIWHASVYAMAIPHDAAARIAAFAANRNYLAAASATGSMVVTILPLIFAPIVLLAAFSGFIGFLRELTAARKRHAIQP